MYFTPVERSLCVYALISSLSLAIGVRADVPSKLPWIQPGFRVEVFAQEPLIRNPSALCFDRRGRLFVGQGPQFRHPKPTTPGDSIKILLDTDNDGVADEARIFATGFNCIQGLVWKGNDLWVANAPDLTIVRDTDGDDEADEYVLVYTDLGNLEHGLHGLHWAPNGKLYMSKGNSKGINRGSALAPRPFRELWNAESSRNASDPPQPQTFDRAAYSKSFQDPQDDWGREGGILRCDDLGENLEIVARGFRNPWDMAFDDEFNFLGTDNDQDGGDKIFMPFYGAHFGWGHPWSYDWTGERHPPTAPASGPFTIVSGTGVVYYASRQLPESHRGVFFLNDWGAKTTYLYRPKWDGARLEAQGGSLEVFVRQQKHSLYAPTDIEVGPDGALYIGGWSSGYGVQWRDDKENGEQVNEGRVFRVSHPDHPLRPAQEWRTPKRQIPPTDWTLDALIADLTVESLPVWRTEAQAELVRRAQDEDGKGVRAHLIATLDSTAVTRSQETWLLWALGQINSQDSTVDEYFARLVEDTDSTQLNRQLQSLRILAHRARNDTSDAHLPGSVERALKSEEPRVRFEAVQAIWQANQTHSAAALLDLTATESDRVTFYTAWNALRDIAPPAARKRWLEDPRDNARFAVVLGFLGSEDLTHRELLKLVRRDPDERIQEWTLRWLATASASPGRAEKQSPARTIALRPIVQQYEKTASPKLRTQLLQFLAAAPYSRKDWRRLRTFYRRKKSIAQQDGDYEDAAWALRGLARYSYALPMLWRELEGPPLLRVAALEGFERLGERACRFLRYRLKAAVSPAQLSGTVEALTRVTTSPKPWRPEACRVERLAVAYGRSDDPLLRMRILRVLTSMAWDQSKSSGPRRRAIALAHQAACDPDPRLHKLAPELAHKLKTKLEVIDEPALVSREDVRPLIASASLRRGRAIFFDESRANCAACHHVDGDGAFFAPPLSEIGSRNSVDELLESILNPNARIVEGYHVTTIVTRQGQTLTGVVREETNASLQVLTAEGRLVSLQKADIHVRSPSKASVMPSFAALLKKDELADLAAWLLTRKTQPSGMAQSDSKAKTEPATESEPNSNTDSAVSETETPATTAARQTR